MKNRHTFRLAEFFHLNNKLLGELEGDTGAAKGLNYRARPVGLDFKNRQIAGKDILPVFNKYRQPLLSQPFLLPVCIIGELNRQIGQGRVLPGAEGLIQFQQFADEDLP